ncbi:MAG: AI-2E family transporter, partial [Candidatus Poseidoniia archaeon]
MQSDAGALEQRIQTVCLLILATAAAGACLFWLRPALLPFVLALFIALGLTPLVDFQVERLRLPCGLAVAATGLIALLLIWLLGSLLSTSIGQLAENANRYQTQVDALLTTASQKTAKKEEELAKASMEGKCIVSTGVRLDLDGAARGLVSLHLSEGSSCHLDAAVDVGKGSGSHVCEAVADQDSSGTGVLDDVGHFRGHEVPTDGR